MKKNLEKVMKQKELLLFAGGAVSAIAVKKIIESDAAKKFCTNTVAKVMEIQNNAEEAFQNMKDDAEEIRTESKEKTKEEIYKVEVEEKPNKKKKTKKDKK